MPGTLFVVGTPIGNLEDITLRALRTLREVDLIAAEDTRRTSKLLAHYEIRRPLASLHEHNEAAEAGRLVSRLLSGQSIALVSDAGTPGISDPGATLVRAARDAGCPVVPIPGPSAVAAVLSVSGLACDTHRFMGFPPSSGAARDRWFERAAAESGVVVAFEGPHRVRRTLDECLSVMAYRQILVFRELTKSNEELVVYSNTNASLRERGEFTIVIGPASERDELRPDDGELFRLFGRITNSEPLEDSLAADLVARYFNVPVRRVRKAVKRGTISVKRRTSADS